MRYFIIFAQQRSGSNLLMNLIRSHPDIHLNSWMLTDDVEKNGETWAFEQGFHMAMDKSRAIIGFTAYLKQNLHQHIRQRQGVKILFLHRKNRLATLLSRNMSHRLSTYIAPERGIHSMEEAVERRSEMPPLHIPVEEAEGFFEEWSAKTKEVLDCFEGTDWLQVFYEDLCRDPEPVMRRVYQHFELPFHPVAHTPGDGSVKLDQRPLHEAIENYEGLKAYFTGTPWEAFFE